MNEHPDARRLNQSMKRSDMPRTVAAFKHAEREATAIAQVLSLVITLDRYERLRDRILVCPEIELASIDDALSTHDVFLRSARIGRRRQQMGEALGEAHAERWRAFDERVMKEARAVVVKHPEIRHQKDRSTKLIKRALNRLPAARIETLNGGPLVTHEETEQFITRLKERLGARLSALFNAR